MPAAGRGERAGEGTIKQFRPIAGVPMLLRAIRPFAAHPRVRRSVVALPPDIVRRPPGWLAEVAGERLVLVAGGATRADSVAAALAALPSDCAVILVHDAARPFVTPDTIDAVIAAAAAGHAAVAAVPLGDTLKRADGADAAITETVRRDHLWRAQTPQGFPRALLERAYAGRRGAATDDAELVERLGETVRLVPDRTGNIKVTTADDFLLAEALAAGAGAR